MKRLVIGAKIRVKSTGEVGEIYKIEPMEMTGIHEKYGPTFKLPGDGPRDSAKMVTMYWANFPSPKSGGYAKGLTEDAIEVI